MSKLRVSLACREYDRTRPLLDGTVRVEGMDLHGLGVDVPEVFQRMLRNREFDVSEMSLSTYTVLHSRGDVPFIAIPVFPYRCFRHSFIFVNADAGIRRPQELRGKRVGIPEYQSTATVWIRGLLQHDYDVPPASVHWLYGGQEEPRRPSGLVTPPEGVRLEPIPQGKTLSGMLETGEIDALTTPSMPSSFLRGSPKVQRLFPNYRQVEEAYFKKSGLFPIMHTVVMKRELYDDYPWVATSLCKAFEEAKALCYRELYEGGSSRYMLAWGLEEVERERQVLGSDFWPYGFEANRHTLEVFTQYVWEQGLTARKVEPRELFAPNTLGRAS